MTSVANNSEGKVLEIKTVQIAPFRTLMPALKHILLETNITFKPDGIRIINMDISHTILVEDFILFNESIMLLICKSWLIKIKLIPT